MWKTSLQKVITFFNKMFNGISSDISYVIFNKIFIIQISDLNGLIDHWIWRSFDQKKIQIEIFFKSTED